MALDFNATTEEVHCGTDSSLLTDQGTLMAWVKPISGATTVYQIFAAGQNDAFSEYITLASASGRIDMERSRATTVLHIRENAQNFANGVWRFIACVFDINGVDGDQKGYGGSLTAAPTEISTYMLQQVGSGTAGSYLGSTEGFGIGNYTSNPGWLANDNSVAWVGFYTTTLTLAQIQQVWRNCTQPINSSMVLNMHLGVWGSGGTGTQKDLSGSGNDGTLTGATKSDHPPINIFPRPRMLPWYATAAAGGFMTTNKGWWGP